MTYLSSKHTMLMKKFLAPEAYDELNGEADMYVFEMQ